MPSEMNSTLRKYLSLPLVLVAAAISRAAESPAINLRRTITVEVVERTKDAVVNISALKIIAQKYNPFAGNPFFQDFDFGQTRMVPASSLGSGFIVHASGYVVTNNHVI